MIPGMESPFSGVGNLRSELESKLQGKANSYEVSALCSKVDNLEHTNKELRTQIDGLRFELQAMQESIVRLTFDSNT